MGQSSNTTGTGGKERASWESGVDTLADGVDEYAAATWTQNIIEKYCSANGICVRDEVTGQLEKEFVNMRADCYPITDPTDVQWRLV